MQLGELIKQLQEYQKSWTDDTEVWIDFDAPYSYAVDEVIEDDGVDGIVLRTHPFGYMIDDEEDSDDFEVE